MHNVNHPLLYVEQSGACLEDVRSSHCGNGTGIMEGRVRRAEEVAVCRGEEEQQTDHWDKAKGERGRQEGVEVRGRQ